MHDQPKDQPPKPYTREDEPKWYPSDMEDWADQEDDRDGDD